MKAIPHFFQRSTASVKYHAAHNEESEQMLPQGAQDTTTPALKTRAGQHTSWIMALVLTVVNIGLLGHSISHPMDKDGVCSSYISQFDSPILDHVPIKYSTKTFSGSLLKHSEFTQPDREKADRAWNNSGADFASIIVPESEAERYGLDSRQVKVSPDEGGGFVALIEGFHHIHCVNLLRQALWFNYDYYRARGDGAFTNNDRILKFHTNHCVDILRQQIMCTADTSVFGQWWVNGVGPWVDFNTKHKCKNYDDMLAWARRYEEHRRDLKNVTFRQGDLMLSAIP